MKKEHVIDLSQRIIPGEEHNFPFDIDLIECQTAYNQPAHVTLFKANIPLVESLTNLDAVENGNYLVFILPLPIERGDASPVRVTAIAKEAFKDLI